MRSIVNENTLAQNKINESLQTNINTLAFNEKVLVSRLTTVEKTLKKNKADEIKDKQSDSKKQKLARIDSKKQGLIRPYQPHPPEQIS